MIRLPSENEEDVLDARVSCAESVVEIVWQREKDPEGLLKNLVAEACSEFLTRPNYSLMRNVVSYVTPVGLGNPLVAAKIQLGEFYLKNDVDAGKLQNLDKIILFHRFKAVIKILERK